MLDIVTDWSINATLLDWVTNITSFFLVCLLALVIIGFRRYIKHPRSAPIDFIGTGLWLLAATALVRRMFWDLAPGLFSNFENWAEVGLQSRHVNWVFNLCAIIACYYLLKGYHVLVERRVPGRYNIFTCVFYPNRLWLMVVAKDEPINNEDIAKEEGDG